MADEETGRSVEGATPGRRPELRMPDDFASFRYEHWYEWIRKFLNGEYVEPAIVVGDREPYTALASLYESLESDTQRDLFTEAVGDLFAHTALSDGKARVFRSLIELVAMLTPYHVKDVVRARLYMLSFKGMMDGRVDLHNQLLAANCKYVIDLELAEYIERTAHETDDIGYILVCLRAVAEPGGTHYLRFLRTALSHANTQERAALLAREVGDIIYLHGCRHFCKWYTEAAREIGIGHPLYDSFQRFEGALKKHAFPEVRLLSARPDDPFRTLVAAQLHAFERRFDAREVLDVARLYQHTGKPTTVNALLTIWQRIQAKIPSEGRPWYYYAPNKGRASDGALLPASISSGPNYENSVSANFLEIEEPLLAEILEKIKDIFYKVPNAEEDVEKAQSATSGG